MSVKRGDVVLVDFPFADAITCENFFTVNQARIIRTLGRAPNALMLAVDDCLKAALDLQ